MLQQMQKCLKKVTQQSCFSLRFCADFGGLGGLSPQAICGYCVSIFTFPFFLRFCNDFGAEGASPSSNLRVLCEHLHLPKAQQVEFKARIIAMIFAVNSTC